MKFRNLWHVTFAMLAASLPAVGSAQGGVPFNASYVLMPFYGNFYLHDPSPVIKDGSNYFIDGDGQGISGITSADLRNWTVASPVFPGNPPAWTTNAVPGFTGYFWAPDIAYFNGRYNLYYAASQWGTINSAIGLVTSPSLASPVWTDQGKVIQSNPVGETTTNTDLTDINCIDPSILLDTNGTIWMSFGSYSDGIMMMELNPSTGKRMAANSPLYRVSNNGPVFFSNTEEASFLYQHGGFYYLFVNWGGCCAGVDSTYNIRVGRATNVIGPYFDKNGAGLVNGGGTVFLESSARYIGPGQAGIMNDNGTNWFTFHYYDGNNNGAATVGMNQIYWSADGWPILTNDWSAFYTFQVDAREHFGRYNGTLENGASLTNDPARGPVLSLDGSSQYVRLPNPVANANTFAAWVKWNGGPAWQRIFDFGTGTNQYLFLTPGSGSGNLRFAITTNGSGLEQRLDAPTALPLNSWCHVAVSLTGTNGVLYLDGISVASNSNLNIRPWQVLAAGNYVGRSQFPPDPYFNGCIGSFRIFDRALSAAEIMAIASVHPACAERYSFDTNSAGAGWDSIGMAHGVLMGHASVTGDGLQLSGAVGDYVHLPGGLVSGSSAVTFECWAAFGSNSNWARLVDFGGISGQNGSDYFFYSPHASPAAQEMQLSAGTSAAARVPGVLDHQSVCLTCVIDPADHDAEVYTNGVLEESFSNSWPAFSSVNMAWSFIGRSLFAADPGLNATIRELRLYDGCLSPQQISVDDASGPKALALPVTLSGSVAGSALTFSWPAWALGCALYATTNLNGGAWTPVSIAPALSNNQWSVTIPMTNAVAYYRLQK